MFYGGHGFHGTGEWDIPYGCKTPTDQPDFKTIAPIEIFEMWKNRENKNKTKFLLIITDSCYSELWCKKL